MILKMQGREFDTKIKELNISGKGIEIMETFRKYSGLMSDVPVVSEQLKEAVRAGKKLFK